MLYDLPTRGRIDRTVAGVGKKISVSEKTGFLEHRCGCGHEVLGIDAVTDGTRETDRYRGYRTCVVWSLVAGGPRKWCTGCSQTTTDKTDPIEYTTSSRRRRRGSRTYARMLLLLF